MSRLFATTAAIAALVAPSAYAAEESESGSSGFYLGANAGVSRADTRKNDFDQVLVETLDFLGAPISDGTSSLDDRDTTYEFTVGYRVDSWLAVEAEYLDLGEVSYQADGEIAGSEGSLGIDLERAGLGLSALVIVPLDNVDLFARAGVFYADTDYTVGASFDGQSESVSFADSTEEFFWGLGGSYHFADRWSARLEYRTYDKVGDSNSSIEADVNTLTLGIVYNFSRQ